MRSLIERLQSVSAGTPSNRSESYDSDLPWYGDDGEIFAIRADNGKGRRDVVGISSAAAAEMVDNVIEAMKRDLASKLRVYLDDAASPTVMKGVDKIIKEFAPAKDIIYVSGLGDEAVEGVGQYVKKARR